MARNRTRSTRLQARLSPETLALVKRAAEIEGLRLPGLRLLKKPNMLWSPEAGALGREDRSADVRLGAHNGLKSDMASCPKSANSGSDRCHSITTSARAINPDGTERPSALAVLRFIAK
jgi:hypothetical protein